MAEAIRLMHVVHRVGLGGTEYGVIKLVNALRRDRFSPSICAMRPSFPEARSQLRADVPVYELHRKEGLDWRLPFALARRMRHDRTDLVHSHNWGTYPYAVAGAMLAGVPTIVHGLHGRETAMEVVPLKRRVVEGLLARCTHGFTAVSRELYEEARARYRVADSRIRYCPNGIDLARFDGVPPASEVRAGLGLPGNAPVIAWVATIRPVKDPLTLLRAFALVRREIPDARLLMVGLDLNGRFRERIPSDWGGWSTHVSHIVLAGTRTDVPEILSSIDVYVNSSVYEGQSNTILEAMAARKPLVATAVGGNPDLVADGQTGFLVRPGDPETMADRILHLLRHPERSRAMGEAGRAIVEAKHTFQSSVRNLTEFYETLHGRRSRPRTGG